MPLLVVGRLTPANVRLVSAARGLGVAARLLPPEAAERRARLGETVLGRIDVLEGLDGVEPGLDSLRLLEAAGFCVLNRADAILAAHDKLETARRLRRHGIPHPRTLHVAPDGGLPEVETPVVLKPRFGSWGADVVRCDTRRELRRAFSRLSRRHWFRLHGILVQELVPPPGSDLRVLVSEGKVVGAVSRVAAPGEWRTNISLGGTRRPAIPSRAARELAGAAAAAVGGDLVGVDLLPTETGYVVLEVNGCVDFTEEYSLPGGDVFDDAVEPLLFPFVAELEQQQALAAEDDPLLVH